MSNSNSDLHDRLNCLSQRAAEASFGIRAWIKLVHDDDSDIPVTTLEAAANLLDEAVRNYNPAHDNSGQD